MTTNDNKRIYAATDVGRERTENQDNYALIQLPAGTLLVVCDGMGGHEGGATASKLAVDAIVSTFQKANIDVNAHDSVQEVMYAALTNANGAVLEGAATNPALKGMGTTAVIALISGRKLFVAHVGDSRLYHVREGLPATITKDHTTIRAMLDANLITPEQAKNHPEAHKLSKAIGHRADMEPEVRPTPVMLEDGDTLLLCSDGLYDVVEDDEIARYLMTEPANEAVHNLINLANSRGGPDNITIGVYYMPGERKPRTKTARMNKTQVEEGQGGAKTLVRFWPYFAAIGVAVALAVGALWFFGSNESGGGDATEAVRDRLNADVKTPGNPNKRNQPSVDNAMDKTARELEQKEKELEQKEKELEQRKKELEQKEKEFDKATEAEKENARKELEEAKKAREAAQKAKEEAEQKAAEAAEAKRKQEEEQFKALQEQAKMEEEKQKEEWKKEDDAAAEERRHEAIDIGREAMGAAKKARQLADEAKNTANEALQAAEQAASTAKAAGNKGLADEANSVRIESAQLVNHARTLFFNMSPTITAATATKEGMEMQPNKDMRTKCEGLREQAQAHKDEADELLKDAKALLAEAKKRRAEADEESEKKPNDESEKKPNDESEKKPNDESEKKPNDESEKKPNQQSTPKDEGTVNRGGKYEGESEASSSPPDNAADVQEEL